MTTEVLRPTGDPAVTLTTYVHDASPELSNAKLRPAVLVFPGGGYQFCSDREGEPIALAYMAKGYNAFVLRYTVKKDVETPLHDAETALETIMEKAGEWKVDKSRIAVIGFSAGGHLAAHLSVAGRLRPAAAMLGYPCILDKKIEDIQLPDLTGKVDATTPPCFIFSTSEDKVVPIANSLDFASALDKAKVPFELHIYQNGEHGLSLAAPLTANGGRNMVEPAFAGWFEDSIVWLRGLFGDFAIS